MEFIQFNKNDSNTYIQVNNEKHPLCKNHSIVYNNGYQIELFNSSIHIKYNFLLI